ncbi:MAG: ABC transporter ATP-binding protein [Bacteroidia bacterium]|nr:ABC transporter ATP-binding protein [Bacteroidia bacterium]
MIGLKFILEIRKKFNHLLDDDSRKKYSLIIFLSIVNAILELAGVSLLLYTILAIFEPDFIEKFQLTSYLYYSMNVNSPQFFVLFLTGGLFLLYVIKNILLIQISKLQIRYSFSINEQISNDYYRDLIESDLVYFNSQDSTHIMNNIMGATLNFSESILLSSVLFISEWFIVTILLGAVLIFQPWLFLFVFIVLVPTAGALVYFNKKSIEEISKEEHELIPKIYDNINHLTRGISTIKLWSSESYFIKNYQVFRDRVYTLKSSIYLKSNYIPVRTYEVIAIAGLLCVVVYGTYVDLEVSSIVAYISIYAAVSFRILPSINRIITSSNNLASRSHVLDYLIANKTDNKIYNRQNQLEFNHQIELSKADFFYSGCDPILSSVSMTVSKGDFIGLIGESGSGKSTVLLLVSSLLIAQKGQLKIDGVSIDSSNVSDYRYLFSYVNQDVFMLNDTILKNIAFADANPNQAKIKDCLNKVNLTNWVESLPNGIHTSIGELGSQISGGQRQRIAIARALYKDSEIFLFDEISNNLDEESKAEILKTMKAIKREGKTAIFVTHNREELEICNVIYSIENNKINRKEELL